MHGTCVVERDGVLYAIALSWRNGGENEAGKKENNPDKLNDGAIAIFKAVELETKIN